MLKDLLLRLLNLNKAKGIVLVLVLLGAFGLGLYFAHFTHFIDHPIEQIAEDVLDDYGIDVDFSEDKKKNLPDK